MANNPTERMITLQDEEITFCCAIARDSNAYCGTTEVLYPSKFTKVIWRSFNAQDPSFETAGWLGAEIPLCHVHRKMIKAGKVIEFKFDGLNTNRNINNQKENTMEDTYHGRPPLDTNCGCVRDPNSGEISYCEDHYEAIMLAYQCGPELINYGFGEEGILNEKMHQKDDLDKPWLECERCEQTKPDVTTKHVAEELGDFCNDCASELAEEFNKEMEREMNKKRILCGNCRKNGVEDPYHDTAAEVRACYNRVSTFNRPKKGIKCANCKKYHDTTDEVKECFNNES